MLNMQQANFLNKYKFLLIATAVLWSTGGVLIKSVDWNPLAIAGSRSLIAALAITAIMGKPRWKHSKTQWAAAIAYALTVLSFVLAYHML